VELVQQMVERHTEGLVLGLLGEPRVNVLERVLAKKILARIPAPTTPHLKWKPIQRFR